MLREVIWLARIRDVGLSKKKNNNFTFEIVKYRFAEELKIELAGRGVLLLRFRAEAKLPPTRRMV